MCLFLIALFDFPETTNAQSTGHTEPLSISACVNENIVINEEMTLDKSSLTLLLYDLCPRSFLGSGELVREQAFAQGYSLRGAFTAYDMADGQYYSFVTNNNSNSISRISHGDSLSSEGTTELLAGPANAAFQGIELLRVNGAWTGIASATSGQLYRLSMSEGLSGEMQFIPIAGTDEIASDARDIKILQKGGKYYAFVISSQKILRLVLSSDFATVESISQFALAQNYLTGIEVIEAPASEEIIIFCTSFFGGLFKLKLSSVDGELINISKEEVPGGEFGGLSVEEFEGVHHLFVQTSSKALILTYEDIFASPTQVLERPELMAGASVDFDVYYFRGDYYTVATSYQLNKLFTWKLKDECNWVSKQAIAIEDIDEAVVVSFNQAGIFPIALYAYDREGNWDRQIKYIGVQDKYAPLVEVLQGNSCIAGPVELKVENLTTDVAITSYTWTFPDGSQQNTEEASYQFVAAGPYTVRLDVESENGCGNFYEKKVTVYPEPLAAYEVSTSQVCTNAAVIFNNQTNYAADSVISYSWDFGDGITSIETNPQHEFAEPGTYTVSLSASIPGCTSTSTQTIEVQEGPKALFEASAVCQGEALAFKNLTSGESIIGYKWDLGNGTYSMLENPEQIYEAPGTYLVMLQAKNDLGCETSFTQSVRVYSLPQPDFKNSPACEGNRVQFTDATLDVDGNIIAWNWAFEMPGGTTLISNEQNPEVAYSQAGSYDVSLTTTTTWNCQKTVMETVEVAPMPQVEILFEGACVGDSAILADVTNTDSLSVQSWYWMVGNEVYTDSAFSFHFAQAGTYELLLQLNLENGCSVQGTKQITVEPLPAVDFAFSGACVGQVAAFEALTPSAKYSWTIDGKPIGSEGPEIQYTFNEEGTYRVNLMVFDEQGCTNSLSKEIVVGQPPVAAFSPDRLRGVAPFKVNFSNQSEGAATYRWLFDDKQQSSSSLENPVFTFKGVGNYTVQLIAYNEGGCADTVSQQLTVLDPCYDVALTSLHKISEGNRMQLVLGLENKGTIRVSEMEVEVILNNEYVLREQFTDTLEIGEQRNYPLRLVLDEQDRRKLDFVCIRLKPKLMLVPQELSVLNNEMCLNFNQTFIMQPPHPNPGSDEVMLSFVLPDTGGSVAVEVYSAQGNLVQKGELKDTKAGFNQHLLNIRGLGKGMYYVRCRYGAEQHSYRIVKN